MLGRGATEAALDADSLFAGGGSLGWALRSMPCFSVLRLDPPHSCFGERVCKVEIELTGRKERGDLGEELFRDFYRCLKSGTSNGCSM